MPHRLAHHPSAFVRQHAHHGVDWHVWSSEALSRAQAEDKPLLVFLGHATGQACQHLRQACWERPATAASMNAGFVNVLVDRASRPDLDGLFRDAHGVLQPNVPVGSAPQTVFCSARGLPFHSVVWPVTSGDVPALDDVLATVAHGWRDQREALLSQARAVRRWLMDKESVAAEHLAPELTLANLLRAARMQWIAAYDAQYGGFGGWPHQAHPTVLLTLLHLGQQGDDVARDMARNSLRHMAQGALFDAAHGGFFHACELTGWRQPWPEKTLADNAMLTIVYAQACLVDDDPLWRSVIEATVRFVLRDLRATLCDAHSPPLRGGFCTAWAVDGASSVRDTHQSTALNALMLRALAWGARACQQPAWLRLARETLGHVCQTRLTPEDRLLACSGQDGSLDDHAFLLEAVLTLHALDPRPGDLPLACTLADALHTRFEDPVDGGFFFSPHDAPPLWHRAKPTVDRVTPSGNASAVRGLAMLGRAQDWASVHRAEESLRSQMVLDPASHAALLLTTLSVTGVSQRGSAQFACPTGA